MFTCVKLFTTSLCICLWSLIWSLCGWQGGIQKLNETYRKLKFDWDSTFVTIHRGTTSPPLDPPCYLRPTMHMASALKTEFTQAQCYLICNPSVYGDKGGTPVELQLPVSLVQLLYFILSGQHICGRLMILWRHLWVPWPKRNYFYIHFVATPGQWR